MKLLFQQSESEENSFHEGLKVGVYQEAVPMGVDPKEVSYKGTGIKITENDHARFFLACKSLEQTSGFKWNGLSTW